MEKILYDLTVSPELEHLIPPLEEMELSMLTESILANGCEMPLVVWNGTIVDGHNRYRICREHGIPFAVEEKEFEDMDAAKIWLIKNQLGRRNLPKFVKCELVVPLEEIVKAEAEKRRRAAISDSRRGERNAETPQNSAASQKETRDALSDMAGVSHDTFGKAKRIMASADEEIKDKLRRGEMSIHRAYTDLKKPKEEPQTEKTADPVTEQVSPKQPEPKKPEPKKPERPKFESLLKKPVFDRNQPPCTVEGVIPIEPIVSEATMAAFEAAKRKEEAALSADASYGTGKNADVTGDVPSAIEDEPESEPEAEPEADVDAADTVEQDVQELIDDFLEELSSVLDSVDSMDAERILEMVRDAGERAVHTVETYMKKMEG